MRGERMPTGAHRHLGLTPWPVDTSEDEADQYQRPAECQLDEVAHPSPSNTLMTSAALKRRCPPMVRMAASFPAPAQRVTVFGSTRKILATSFGVRSRPGSASISCRSRTRFISMGASYH